MGKTIRKARETKELTLAALGEAVGVTGGAVGQWETGKSHPKPEARAKLAKALGVPPSAFKNGDARTPA